MSRQGWRALAIVLALCGTSAALAGTKLRLYPLTGSNLPKPLRGAPTELTRVLAKSLDATPVATPVEDVATVLSCSLTERACLETLAKEGNSEKLVFGKVEPHSGGVVVRLTTFARGGEPDDKRYVLEGETIDELSQAFEKQLTPRPTRIDPPIKDPKDPKIKDPIDPKDPKDPKDPTKDPKRREIPSGPDDKDKTEQTGAISGGTWTLLIGGGVAAAGGGGLLLSANSLRREILRAPTDTFEDLKHLEALENAAKLRTYFGVALVAGGGVALAFGVYRALNERRAPATSVDVVPEAGGGSVVLRGVW